MINVTRRSLTGFVMACLAAVGLSAGLAATPARAAEPSADVSAELSTTAVPADGRAMLAVVIDVHGGLHAQSHTPSDPSYIPLVITPHAGPGVTLGDVRYPDGEDKTYPALGKLNVYVDRVIAYVPVTVAAGVQPGPVKVTGTVDLQACNRRACFPPEQETFELTANVVPAGTAVQPNHPDLFTGPDSVLPPADAKPATKPTTAPAAMLPPPTAPTETPATASNATPDGGTTVLGLNLTRGGLPLALIAAFVVGIIFNAMPCVLPILPLKILGFYEVSKQSRGKCLALGATFSLGLVSIFVVLATLIVGLHWINWGGLFQQTWFTVAITAVLLAMAAGTFGLFDFVLPSGVYALAPRHDTYAGNFLFGMLTAFLSTPCTFGLFVALLAWTLTQPAAAGFAVFIMVGVGMASPYLLLSGFPQLARRFPRTGPWSAVVKQEMGFLLLATAVFFAQPLLAHVMPVDRTWWLLFAAVAAGALFLETRVIQLGPPRWVAGVVGAAMAVVIGSGILVTQRFTSHPYTWQPYTPAALAQATAAGHPVVIDFTATWCGNCHWLEGTVLHDRRVVSAVNRDSVVMLQADVTNRNAVGQPLLDRLHPTASIPLTAVYAPHAGPDARPALLDGIYSADDLVNTIKHQTGG